MIDIGRKSLNTERNQKLNDMKKLGMKMFISEIKLMHLKKRIGKPYGKSIDRLLLAAELIRSNNQNDNY